jgi:hypothetical protein
MRQNTIFLRETQGNELGLSPYVSPFSKGYVYFPHTDCTQVEAKTIAGLVLQLQACDSSIHWSGFRKCGALLEPAAGILEGRLA